GGVAGGGVAGDDAQRQEVGGGADAVRAAVAAGGGGVGGGCAGEGGGGHHCWFWWISNMNQAEWLVCSDPAQMLRVVVENAPKRKLRLFAVACCRSIWAYLRDRRSQRVVENSELFADNKVSATRLQAATRGAERAADAIHWEGGLPEHQSAASTVC